MVIYISETAKQGYKIHKLCAKFGKGKNQKSIGWFLLKIVWQGDAAYYLNYAHVHACSSSYTDEERKTLQMALAC